MMKTSSPVAVGLERQPDRLRAVAGVDVAPQVPFPEQRVGVEGREAARSRAGSITFEKRRPIIFSSGSQRQNWRGHLLVEHLASE